MRCDRRFADVAPLYANESGGTSPPTLAIGSTRYNLLVPNTFWRPLAVAPFAEVRLRRTSSGRIVITIPSPFQVPTRDLYSLGIDAQPAITKQTATYYCDFPHGIHAFVRPRSMTDISAEVSPHNIEFSSAAALTCTILNSELYYPIRTALIEACITIGRRDQMICSHA